MDRHGANATARRADAGAGFTSLTALDTIGTPTRITRGTQVQELSSDALGGTVKMTSLDGTTPVVTEQRLDAARRVTWRKSDFGLEESFEYADVLGRLTKSTRTLPSGLSVTTVVTWDDSTPGITTSTATSTFSDDGHVETRTTVTDSRGRVLSTTEVIPGLGPATTSFTFDAQGRQLSVRYPDDAGVSLHYDSAGRLLSRTDEANAVTSWRYEADGLLRTLDSPHPDSLESFEYDALVRTTAHLVRVGTTPDGGDDFAVTRFEYPGNGQVVEVDANGDRHVRTLNAAGAVVSESHLDGGYLVSRRFDGTSLAFEEVREGTWRSTSESAFFPSGRIRQSTQSFSSSGPSWSYVTTHAWAANTDTIQHTWTGAFSGGLTESVTVDGQGLPLSHLRGELQSSWLYDAAGRLLEQSPPGGPTTHFSYGSDGRLASARIPIPAPAEATSSLYDVRGRLRRLESPDGRVLTRTYDARGLVSLESFGLGADVVSSLSTWDSSGNLSSRTAAFGTSDAATTLFDFGPRGELRTVTQPTVPLSVWSYGYDALGRLSSLTPPGTPSNLRPQSWRYDALGRLTHHADGTSSWASVWTDGVVTTTSNVGDSVSRLLDSRGRLLLESVVFRGPSTLPSVDSVSFSFDGLDSLRRLQEGTRPPSIYGYDSSHRLSSVSRGADVVSYSFHPSTPRVSSVTKGASSLSWGYDSHGRLSSLTTPGLPGDSAVISWYPGGQRLHSISWQADSSSSETFCYDGPGRLSSIEYGGSCASPGPSRRVYSRDARGNPRSESFAGLTRTFGYDDADRLTSFTDWDGVPVSYVLHPDGTRTSETVGGVSHDYQYSTFSGALERVVDSISGTTLAEWTYALDGRVSSRTVGGVSASYQWDAFGHLVQSGNWSFEYDGLGLRRSSSLSGTFQSSWTWVGESQVAEGDELLASVGPFLLAQGTTRFTHDALGSVVSQYKPAPPPPPPPAVPVPASSSSARYSVWGVQSGGPQLTSNAFTGHRSDVGTGLTYAQQRWLDSSYGVWLSRDSVGAESYLSTPNGVGSWGYADGNPARHADPDGRAPKATAPPELLALVGNLHLMDIESLDDDTLRGILLEDEVWGKMDWGDLSWNGPTKPTPLYLEQLLELPHDQLVATVCESLSCKTSRATRYWRSITNSKGANAVSTALAAYQNAKTSFRETQCELLKGATQNAIDGTAGFGNEFGRSVGDANCIAGDKLLDYAEGRLDGALLGAGVKLAGGGLKVSWGLAKAGVGVVKAGVAKAAAGIPPALLSKRTQKILPLGVPWGDASKMAVADSRLATAIYDLRENSKLFSRTALKRNVAAVRYKIDGIEQPVLAKVNIKGGPHTEELFATEFATMRAKGMKIEVIELLTERIPCYEKAGCRRMIFEHMPGVRVYFFTRKSGYGAVDELQDIYGAAAP